MDVYEVRVLTLCVQIPQPGVDHAEEAIQLLNGEVFGNRWEEVGQHLIEGRREKDRQRLQKTDMLVCHTARPEKGENAGIRWGDWVREDQR